MTVDDSWVRLAFLSAFTADRLAGRTQPVEHYQAQFPGNERIVEQEFGSATRDEATDEPDTIAGYRRIRLLGRGGQGEVYLAKDTRLDRLVALKLLAPASRAPADTLGVRLLREATLTSRIDDPGICQVYDAGVFEGRVYLAMRYVPGETLAHWIEHARASGRSLSESLGDSEAGRVAWRPVVALIEKAARSLAVAHEAGIVHRDIKPANLMISERGQVVLLDFGLARDTDLDGLTRDGMLGTPAYLAPESISGDVVPADVRSDVWSIGVVLAEALTLRAPFSGGTRDALYRAILDAEPSLDMAGLPRDLRAVIGKCLAKQPSHRYPDAASLADDLRRVLDGQPTCARPPHVLRRVAHGLRRRPLLTGTLATAFLVLLTGLWIQSTMRKSVEADFVQLRSLTRGLMFEVHDAVQYLPGAERGRELLLDRAVTYLRILERRDAGDDRSAMDLLEANKRLGKALAQLALGFGDLDAAERKFQNALGYADRVLSRRPNDAEARLQRLKIEVLLAQLVAERGRHAEAVSDLERLYEIVAQPAPESLESVRWRGLRQTVAASLATALGLAGRPKDAFRLRRESVELLAGLPVGSVAGLLRNATARYNFARAWRGRKRYEEAATEAARSLELLATARDREPHNTRVQTRLAQTRSLAASIAYFRGQHDDARSTYERTVEELELACRLGRDPLVAVRSLCMVSLSFAEFLRRTGASRQAIRTLHAAERRIPEDVWLVDTTSEDMRLVLDLRMTLGEQLMLIGRDARAVASFEAILPVLRERACMLAGPRESLRLAQVLYQRARLAVRARDRATVEQSVTEALEVLASRPELTAEQSSLVAHLHLRRTEGCLLDGDFAGAERSLDRVEHLRKAARGRASAWKLVDTRVRRLRSYLNTRSRASRPAGASDRGAGASDSARPRK